VLLLSLVFKNTSKHSSFKKINYVVLELCVNGQRGMVKIIDAFFKLFIFNNPKNSCLFEFCYKLRLLFYYACKLDTHTLLNHNHPPQH
jgi:hypothetical protein